VGIRVIRGLLPASGIREPEGFPAVSAVTSLEWELSYAEPEISLFVCSPAV